jgi:hypothetical protein
MAAIIGDAHGSRQGINDTCHPWSTGAWRTATLGEQRRWANSDAGRTATLGEQQRDGLELAGRCPW